MFEDELKIALRSVERASKKTRTMIANREAAVLRERIVRRLELVREDLEALDRALNPPSAT